MVIPALSPVAVTAYQDLRRLLLDEAVSDLRGTLVLKDVNGRNYWYDHYRIGSDSKDRYIGEDGPELRARLDRHKALAAEREARSKNRARLIRLLRAEGAIPVDRETGAMLRAFSLAGFFRVGGVLVGTQAFRLYEGELGVRIGVNDMAMTADIDIAGFEQLSVSIGDHVEEEAAVLLRQLEFTPVPELDPKTVWRWKQVKGDALVEFLTPSFGEDEGIRTLPSLGVQARALHYMNYLIAEPIQAAALYRDGVLVRIPRPERFAIHKLIVANRRQAGEDALKSRKDRAQAAFLIHVLAEDRPYDLKEAYETARDMGPKWRERIDATLERMPEERAVLENL